MNHSHCYLHDDTIRTLRHSILLRHIWGRRLFLDTMILKEIVVCHRNKLPGIVWLKRLNFVLRLHFYKGLELLEVLKIFPLNFNAYIHVSWKSSMKVMKYLVPPIGLVCIELHMSECTLFKGLVSRFSLSFGNIATCCLSLIHVLQNNEDMGQENLPRFIPLNMFRSVWTLFTFNWPRRRYQSLSTLSPVRNCVKLVLIPILSCPHPISACSQN